MMTDANFGYCVIFGFLIAVCIGVIPASIARSKGRDFVTWWIYGTLAFIVAFPASLFIKAETVDAENREIPTRTKDDPRTLALIERLQGASNTVQPPPPSTMPRPGTPIFRKCPDCAEEVRAEARKCRFCGYIFRVEQVDCPSRPSCVT